jgi:MOSC domain-containing protein YiiM
VRSTRELVEAVPQVGRLEAILLRTAKHAEVRAVTEVLAVTELGLTGDHRSVGREPSPRARRQVTLVQAEHLPVVAGLVGRSELDPRLLRRNLVVSGINVASLRDRSFTIGGVRLLGTGWCHPCSRMEEELGSGGFQAVRGHGGITARILEGGRLTVGDHVEVVAPTEGVTARSP